MIKQPQTMKQYNIHAATPYIDEPINVQINITAEAPELDLEKHIDHQWEEAEHLYDILSESIPQGVMTKLFALIAKTEANHIIHSSKRMKSLIKEG